MCVAVVRNSSELEFLFNLSPKEDEERRRAAASFSAVGSIFLGHQQKQKQAPKAWAVMPFLLFNLNFK